MNRQDVFPASFGLELGGNVFPFRLSDDLFRSGLSGEELFDEA